MKESKVKNAESVLSDHNILGKLNQRGFTPIVKSAMADYVGIFQSRITELETELLEIKQTIDKDPVSFILVFASRFLNDDDKSELLDKLGSRTSKLELEAENKKLREALMGIIHLAADIESTGRITVQALKNNQK